MTQNELIHRILDQSKRVAFSPKEYKENDEKEIYVELEGQLIKLVSVDFDNFPGKMVFKPLKKD